jgi:hypothetical protein
MVCHRWQLATPFISHKLIATETAPYDRAEPAMNLDTVSAWDTARSPLRLWGPTPIPTFITRHSKMTKMGYTTASRGSGSVNFSGG